jgi:enoyl-CoA hydratase/carnithine racemase
MENRFLSKLILSLVLVSLLVNAFLIYQIDLLEAKSGSMSEEMNDFGRILRYVENAASYAEEARNLAEEARDYSQDAANYAQEAAYYSSDAFNEAQDAAEFAEDAFENSFGRFCGRCPGN